MSYIDMGARLESNQDFFNICTRYSQSKWNRKTLEDMVGCCMVISVVSEFKRAAEV
jgi:hypothetical protein